MTPADNTAPRTPADAGAAAVRADDAPARGTVADPVAAEDLSDAFAICRERDQPTVCRLPSGKLSRFFPSGRLEIVASTAAQIDRAKRLARGAYRCLASSVDGRQCFRDEGHAGEHQDQSGRLVDPRDHGEQCSSGAATGDEEPNPWSPSAQAERDAQGAARCRCRRSEGRTCDDCAEALAEGHL